MKAGPGWIAGGVVGVLAAAGLAAALLGGGATSTRGPAGPTGPPGGAPGATRPTAPTVALDPTPLVGPIAGAPAPAAGAPARAPQAPPRPPSFRSKLSDDAPLAQRLEVAARGTLDPPDADVVEVLDDLLAQGTLAFAQAEALVGSEDLARRRLGALALGRLGTPEALQALDALGRDATAPRPLRLEALRSLVRAAPYGRGAVRGIAADAEAEVAGRLLALDVLAGDPSERRFLRELARDPEPAVQAHARELTAR